MSAYSELPKHSLLTSDQLIAPERKWAPRVLLPGEIPIPVILLQDEQFFTTTFAQTVAHATIERLPKDLETIQETLSNKPRMQAREKILDQVRGNFDAFLADRKPGQPFCYWFGPTLTHRAFEKGSGP